MMSFLYRFSHSRNYWHNQNLWPYIKIKRTDSDDIAELHYKKQKVPIVTLSDLKDSCKGPILLTATGPSVNSVCFNELPDMPAMGVNGAFRLQNKINFQFYVIVDIGFTDQRLDIIEEIIQVPNLILFTTVQCMVIIIDHFTLAGVKCRFSVVEDATCKIYRKHIPLSELWDHYHKNRNVFFSPSNKTIAFSYDIRYGVFDAGTVVYWAFQIIAFLGFKQLFISGLDMNNFHLPRFYETQENKLPTFLPEKVDDLIIPAFIHAAERMEKRKMVTRNFSLNSKIDTRIFEKIDSNYFFKDN